MSDGTWDGEYRMRWEYRDQIFEICKEHNLHMPNTDRKNSKELLQILNNLKENIYK